MKLNIACTDDHSVMNTNETLNPSADRSSTDLQVPSPTDAIAISATELIKMIESGEGTDVNEMISQVLRDRQAA